MKRIIVDDKEYLEVFHTQEARHLKLKKPIICNRSDAWLGVGYYFWIDEEFADFWGCDSKTNTGYYDIYKGYIDEIGILNATFNEKEHFYFVSCIEKGIKHLINKTEKVTLQKVHRFLAERFWNQLGIKGIIYDDLPSNKNKKGRVYTLIEPLHYKKRIQLVVFNDKDLLKFEPYNLDVRCI